MFVRGCPGQPVKIKRDVLGRLFYILCWILFMMILLTLCWTLFMMFWLVQSLVLIEQHAYELEAQCFTNLLVLLDKWGGLHRGGCCPCPLRRVAHAPDHGREIGHLSRLMYQTTLSTLTYKLSKTRISTNSYDNAQLSWQATCTSCLAPGSGVAVDHQDASTKRREKSWRWPAWTGIH